MTGVVKDYHGLRPLRIEQLSVPAGGQTALIGFDQPMAETFVNLVTGATLPEQGTVMLAGGNEEVVDRNSGRFQPRHAPPGQR